MREERNIGRAVLEWYRSALEGDHGDARTARARLRRCESPAEALAVAATHDLNRQLKELNPGIAPTAAQLALLATTFARLRGTDGGELASLFGKNRSRGGRRMLSELRFHSLIRIQSRRELVAPLRRSLWVLGAEASCNGWTLAEDLYWWNDGIRNKWCFQYFGGGFAESEAKGG